MKLVKKYKLEIFCFAVLLLCLPIVKHITYQQNDEWIFYNNIDNFLQGNFVLDALTAPTFYTQGLLATLVATLFGKSSIPLLTLTISIGCIYILGKILQEVLKKSFLETVLYCSFLLFNPIFAYSMWGFMTENYFLFFLLLAIYLLLKGHGKWGIVTTFLAYATRQLGLLIPVAFSIYFIFKGQFKKAVIQFLVFGGLLAFHFFVFPQTPEMFENSLKISNLTYFRYTFSLVFIAGIYLALFLLPVLITYITQSFKKGSKLGTLITILIIFGVFFAANNYFKPSIVWRDKLYYLVNIVQRNGFFIENIHGTKTQFFNCTFLYTILDTIAKVALVTAVILILKKGRVFNLYAIFTIGYILLITISPKIHDRYLLPLFPITILYFAKEIKLTTSSRVGYLLFLLALGLYSYNFSIDYILTNKYVWDTSQKLINLETPPGKIVSTVAWNLKYPSNQSGYVYKFTYDTPEMQNYTTEHTLIETKEIKYPLNFWSNSRIYLYKHKQII